MKLSIVDFNKNISKFIEIAHKGEVVSLTNHGHTVVHLISNEQFNKENNERNKSKSA